MARSFLALALVCLLPVGAVFAQPAPPDAPRAEEGRRQKIDRDFDRRPPPTPGEGPLERFRKKLDQLSPEDRQHFQNNWKRWKEMNEGERRDWQKRAQDEHARLDQNIDEALAKLGLQLDHDQREVFALRYHQERRKLEQQICTEMAQKRSAGLEEMLQRLKTEFSAPKPSPSPTPAPAAAE